MSIPENVYIAGLDIETTGLDFETGDKIIETCIQVYRAHDRHKVINFTQRTSNEDRKINPRAQKVHGIAAADLIGKPTFKAIAPKIIKILSKMTAVVTHNGEWFDLPFMAHEMGRAGLSMPGHLTSFDTMQNGMFATYDTKPPSLRELCYAMGVEYDPAKAHAAEYDVDVMMESFFTAAARGLFDLQGAIANAKGDAA